MSDAIFDTNILIDALNDIKGAQTELAQYRQRYISRATWIEVMTSAWPDDVERAEAFLDYFAMIEIDDEVSRRAAMLRSQRKRLKLADAVILASAQVRNLILITRNTKDFPVTMPGIRVPYQL